jgi:hypothetical protein
MDGCITLAHRFNSPFSQATIKIFVLLTDIGLTIFDRLFKRLRDKPSVESLAMVAAIVQQANVNEFSTRLNLRIQAPSPPRTAQNESVLGNGYYGS